MSRFARHKDTAHRPTVIALRAAGASVQALDVKDGPDLLVGYEGATVLMEVKTITTRTEKDGYQRTRTGKKSEGQETWHKSWRGGPVCIVYGPEEALVKIGVEMHKISNLKTLTGGWKKDISAGRAYGPDGAYRPGLDGAKSVGRTTRQFRPGTDKARSVGEMCKRTFCVLSALPGTNPPRCAAHTAEETFAPSIEAVDYGPPSRSRVIMNLGDRAVDVTGRTNEEIAEMAAQLINKAAEETLAQPPEPRPAFPVCNCGTCAFCVAGKL